MTKEKDLKRKKSFKKEKMVFVRIRNIKNTFLGFLKLLYWKKILEFILFLSALAGIFGLVTWYFNEQNLKKQRQIEYSKTVVDFIMYINSKIEKSNERIIETFINNGSNDSVYNINTSDPPGIVGLNLTFNERDEFVLRTQNLKIMGKDIFSEHVNQIIQELYDFSGSGWIPMGRMKLLKGKAYIENSIFKKKEEVKRYVEALSELNISTLQEINGDKYLCRNNDTLRLDNLKYGSDISITHSIDSILEADRQNNIEIKIVPYPLLATNDNKILIKKIKNYTYVIKNNNFKHYVIYAVLKNCFKDNCNTESGRDGVFDISETPVKFVGWVITPHNAELHKIDNFYTIINR